MIPDPHYPGVIAVMAFALVFIAVAQLNAALALTDMDTGDDNA